MGKTEASSKRSVGTANLLRGSAYSTWRRMTAERLTTLYPTIMEVYEIRWFYSLGCL